MRELMTKEDLGPSLDTVTLRLHDPPPRRARSGCRSYNRKCHCRVRPGNPDPMMCYRWTLGWRTRPHIFIHDSQTEGVSAPS